MIILDDILRDRGSRYAASVGTVRDRAMIDQFLADLRRQRRFARATHHSWAAILSSGGPMKGDDGEAGAGAVILRMLEREAVQDSIVVVTRWYGGVNLGGDRFAHVVTCTRAALAALRAPLDGGGPRR
jgi:putative IMPACT (imprinted ancient) family translation regulator